MKHAMLWFVRRFVFNATVFFLFFALVLRGLPKMEIAVPAYLELANFVAFGISLVAAIIISVVYDYVRFLDKLEETKKDDDSIP